eukprot:jgi/Picsp_1/5873/NSC_03231-R1_protein
MSAPIIGALLGVSVQIYANLVQKLPGMYTPWKHAITGALGAGFASYLVEYEERTAKELDGKTAARLEAEQKRRVLETAQ